MIKLCLLFHSFNSKSNNFYNYRLFYNRLYQPYFLTLILSLSFCHNSDLKLFNYDNIYVCGSSVFPFNGYTNPTWTIMTLALRLSEKLKKNIYNYE